MMPFAAGNVDQGIVKKFREASKMLTGRRLLSFAWLKEIEFTVSREPPRSSNVRISWPSWTHLREAIKEKRLIGS